MKANSWIVYVAGALALVFIISASDCQNETTFIPVVDEICTDNVDNDEDGLIDCKDSDCSKDCHVQLTLAHIATPILGDSVEVTGTHERATSIFVKVTAPGIGGQASISGSTWKFTLTRLTEKITYEVVAIAADSNGLLDTATANFERK